MSEVIYNLEKFVQSQIFLPYKTQLDGEYVGINVPIPRDLEHAKYHLLNTGERSIIEDNKHMKKQASKWHTMTMNRIKECDFVFPRYINHEIVTYLVDKKVARVI